MATLTLQTATKAGQTLTFACAAGGGDVVSNNGGGTILIVNNGSGASINVTVTAQNTSVKTNDAGTVTISDQVVAVGAGAIRAIGPFKPNIFNNTSNQLEISYSSATSVTIACMKVGSE